MKLTVAEHARLNWERLKTVIAAWVAGSVVLSSILIVFIFSRQSSFWQTVWIIVAAEVAINLPFAIWYGLRRIPRSRIGTPSNDLDGRL